MANIYGRQVVVPLVNKSGGGVIAGDVVIVDTANDGAFTTTTSGSFTGGVGVAQETIASLATGRILTAGYAALVNVNASVTRGQYGKTHTVVKQATGTASRGTGTFCQWLTGGTTPTAVLYAPDLNAAAVTVATDVIWDAAGDLVQGTGADTAAKLTAGLSGQVLRSAGAAAANAWAYPPGYEVDYVQITAAVSITATTEGTANTVVTGSAISYDGSTIVMIQFYAPYAYTANTANVDMEFWLYDGASSIGRFGEHRSESTNRGLIPINLLRRITPSNASHTYSIRASQGVSTAGSVGAGAGGAATDFPAFIRITRV